MKLVEVFHRLGLPRHADRVFQILESHGPCSAFVVEHLTHLHRPTVFRALRALVTQTFVAQKKKGKRNVYIAQDRARITTAFTHTATAVAKLANHKGENTVHNSLGSILYFEGAHCVTSVFTDVVEHCKRGETFYRYTSERELDKVNELLPRNYRTRRDAKRLERLVISNIESGSRKRPRLERFVKYLHEGSEGFRHNAIQLIYGNRLAFIDLNAREAFVIENETLASFQKTIFRSLYTKL